MAKIATGWTQPGLVAAELVAWIERLEAALAPVAAFDIAAIDHLAQTVRQGWAVYDLLPEDPRGEQLVMLLRRANAVMAAVEDVVDDMGLTTAAATLTRRVYWRNFSPVRGNRPCPCGRGRASDCRHYWGQPMPGMTIPATAERQETGTP